MPQPPVAAVSLRLALFIVLMCAVLVFTFSINSSFSRMFISFQTGGFNRRGIVAPPPVEEEDPTDVFAVAAKPGAGDISTPLYFTVKL